MSIHVPPSFETSDRDAALSMLCRRTPFHMRRLDQGFDALVVVEADGPQVVRLWDLTNRQIVALMPAVV